MRNSWIYTVDEYGVRNYRSRFLALITLGGLYSVIGLLSLLLLFFESQAEHANIVNYGDAFWTLQMSASTIGFGDFYPVTLGGRTVVALMFYIGVGLVGFIGAIIAERVMGFADTNVKNRELRQQNSELLEYNRQLDAKIELLLQRVDGKSDQTQ